MKKVLMILTAFLFCLLPLTAMAGDGPLKLPDGANAEANKHNEEGIAHWNEGHYDVALKHFQAASKADGSVGEIHYNEALALDKLGQHGEATMHFKAAKKNAHGNENILNSQILRNHIGG